MLFNVVLRGQKQPEHIRDLMGYQALIIDAHNYGIQE